MEARRICHGIAFQPDIQYLIDPAGTREISNAFLLGAKIAIQL
ncbi:MAG: carbohydrate porin [Pseudomonadota bacterium]|nr:carbohydrate porin [Pseudomonadota bacterium]